MSPDQISDRSRLVIALRLSDDPFFSGDENKLATNELVLNHNEDTA